MAGVIDPNQQVGLGSDYRPQQFAQAGGAPAQSGAASKADVYEAAKKEFEGALQQRERAKKANMVTGAHETAVKEAGAALLRSLENYYGTTETPDQLKARITKIETDTIAAANAMAPAAVPAPAPATSIDRISNALFDSALKAFTDANDEVHRRYVEYFVKFDFATDQLKPMPNPKPKVKPFSDFLKMAEKKTPPDTTNEYASELYKHMLKTNEFADRLREANKTRGGTDAEINQRIKQIDKRNQDAAYAGLGLSAPVAAAVPAPAAAPATSSTVPAPALTVAPEASAKYTQALIELRRNYIDSNSSNADRKAAAVAASEGVANAFKTARKAVVAGDDGDQVVTNYRAEFKSEAEAQARAWNALKEVVTKQKNGDAAVTDAAVKTLTQEYVEARAKRFEGIEDRALVEAKTALWVAELKESPVQTALRQLRRNSFIVTVYPNDTDAKAETEGLKSAYKAALKAANSDKTDQQLEADAVDRIAEFAAQAKAHDVAHGQLRDAVKSRAPDEAIARLRGDYIKTRSAALVGIESEVETIQIVDRNIARFKVEAAQAAQAPTPARAPAAAPAVTGEGHTVQPGETLYGIAKKLIAEQKIAKPEGITEHSHTLAMVLILAKKNKIEDYNHIKNGQSLAMPTADETKNGLAYLEQNVMKADGIQGKDISWSQEMKGGKTSNFIPGELSAPPAPAGASPRPPQR